MMVDILNCLGVGYIELMIVDVLNSLGVGYLERLGSEYLELFRVWIS